jgi:SAM-dependent methyltransferase
MAFGIYQIYRMMGQDRFRHRRWELFLRLMQPQLQTRILDVGGYATNWEHVQVSSPITFVNTDYPAGWQVQSERFTSVVGSGCSLPFPDKSFDIVYSNSVIEHVGSREDQRQFAAEINRVGKRVFVQTPNRWFFLEPHFLAPFVHFFPWPIAKWALPRFSIRGVARKGDNKDLRALAEELRFVTRGELKQFFPGCELIPERWLGMTKSFVVIR